MSTTHMSDAVDFRPGFNPQFLAKVRERQKERERQELAKEREEIAAIRQAREMKIVDAKTRKLLLAVKAAQAKHDAREQSRLIRNGEARLRDLIAEMTTRNNAFVVGSRQTMKATFAKFCEEMKVHPEAIRGPGRSREIVKLRHMAMAEIRLACPHVSLPEIARFFHRDHTTVLYALQKQGIPTARAVQ